MDETAPPSSFLPNENSFREQHTTTTTHPLRCCCWNIPTYSRRRLRRSSSSRYIEHAGQFGVPGTCIPGARTNQGVAAKEEEEEGDQNQIQWDCPIPSPSLLRSQESATRRLHVLQSAEAAVRSKQATLPSLPAMKRRKRERRAKEWDGVYSFPPSHSSSSSPLRRRRRRNPRRQTEIEPGYLSFAFSLHSFTPPGSAPPLRHTRCSIYSSTH